MTEAADVHRVGETKGVGWALEDAELTTFATVGVDLHHTLLNGGVHRAEYNLMESVGDAAAEFGRLIIV